MSTRAGGFSDGFSFSVEVDDTAEEVMSIGAVNNSDKTYQFIMYRDNGTEKMNVVMEPGFTGTQGIAKGQRDKMFSGFNRDGFPTLSFAHTLVSA